jgi:hypothetical protein
VPALGFTSCPKDAARGSGSRIDSGSNSNAARRTAVEPAITHRAGRSLTLAIAIIDDYIIPVDALLPAAALESRSRGHKQDQMNRARSLHKI